MYDQVDPVSGRPCSDCLGDNWKSCMNLESVFISIQVIIFNHFSFNIHYSSNIMNICLL